MRPCGVSPFQALLNVFVLPQIQRVRQHPRLARLPKLSFSQSHVRMFSGSTRRLAKTPRAPEQRTQLWNNEIPAQRIVLISDEGGSRASPRTKRDVLHELDEKTHRLVMLTPLSDRPEYGEFIPICRIVSKQEEWEKEQVRKEAKKEAKKATSGANLKTLELNWAIDMNNDLNHRLNRVKEFLSQGKKVEIVLAKKRRGRLATPDECQEVLRRIRQAVGEVKGAREAKPMEGKPGALATLFLEGPK